MPSIIILYLICCVLGYFQMDYPGKMYLKYWQSRYDFSDSMFTTIEALGWILTLLSLVGFPGILVGLIRAKSKERKEKTEREAYYRQRETMEEAEYNKIKNSKIVYEMADTIRRTKVDYFTIRKNGISEYVNSNEYLYCYIDNGLPPIGKGGMLALRDSLRQILGDEWTGSDYLPGDADTEASVRMNREQRKEKYIPSRDW